MAKATHNLVVKSGEYTDDSGQTRNRWQRIGTVFRHDDGGTSVKLESLPVGLPDWEGWVSVFPREEAQAHGVQQSQQQQHYQSQQSTRNFQQRQQQGGRNGYAQAKGRVQTAPIQGPDDFDDDIPF